MSNASEVMGRIAVLADQAGFSGISVRLSDAVKLGYFSPENWDEARKIAEEQRRKDLIEDLKRALENPDPQLVCEHK